MNPRFQAVIWDFGGVLTTSPFEAFNRYESARGLPLGFIRGVNAIDPDSNAWALLERSQIDAETFDAMFRAEARALGHDVRGADILPLLSGEIRPRMVAALDAVRAGGLKIACITNNAPVGTGAGGNGAGGTGAGMAASPEKSAAIAAVLARFDQVIESSKIGLRKPDPLIYQLMCDRLDVDPHACIYLDDLGINCKPAAAMGMTAIKVTGEDQALGTLGQLLEMAF